MKLAPEKSQQPPAEAEFRQQLERLVGEKPSRVKDDRYLAPGQLPEMSRKLRELGNSDLPALVACSFDFRTRLGPFLYADTSIFPAGSRSVAAALHDAGFPVRAFYQAWNPRLRPSHSRLNGRIPELLLVSGMQIHAAPQKQLIADALSLGDDRPLIIAGGAKAIYEPWDLFSFPADGSAGPGPCSADVVVHGKVYVLLELLYTLRSAQRPGEHLRETFERLAENRELDRVAGLMYRWRDPADGRLKLVDTGRERLVKDLDEHSHPLTSLSLLEAPHRRTTLNEEPMPLRKVGRYCTTVSLETSHGCPETCEYCPIPAENQGATIAKSPARLIDELTSIYRATGISKFFGTDDNIMAGMRWFKGLLEQMSKAKIGGRALGDIVAIGTEATVRALNQHLDLVPAMRKAGFRAIWIGVEDLNGILVQKGQNSTNTETVFRTLAQNGIAPMPMMMNYDGLPWTVNKGTVVKGRAPDGSPAEFRYGLKETVEALYNWGAGSFQVTYLTPSIGSKLYAGHFARGEVASKVEDLPVEDYLFDGNHTICSKHASPFSKQLEIFKAYRDFYSPRHLLEKALAFGSPTQSLSAIFQVFGNVGWYHSWFNSREWVNKLKAGFTELYNRVPNTPRHEVLEPRREEYPAWRGFVRKPEGALELTPVG